MIRADQIPDEVVDALWWDGYDFGGELPAQKMRIMRAAIAAALNAWPGSFPHTFRGPLEGYGFILPLPQDVKQSTTEEERA